MTAPSARASLLRIVAQAFPSLLYGYPRTYKVAAVRGDKTLDLVPPPDAPELAELEAVEQWGLGLVTPKTGTEVLVYFRDADPSRPIVIGWEHGADHDRIDLLENDDPPPSPADLVGRVVRYGDSVTVPISGVAATGTVTAGATPSNASRVRG